MTLPASVKTLPSHPAMPCRSARLPINTDNMIEGFGLIGLGGMDLTNEKTVMSSGGLLDIQPGANGLVNTGTMEASSGSTL